jgi:DNA-binding response OmpR family regulator
MRVLIIEDSQVLRRLIMTCLRHHDCEFIEQRLPYSPHRIGGFPEADIVFVGAYRPIDTAVAVMTRLSGRERRPTIIALTTDPREDSWLAMEDAGAGTIIRMPFRPDEIRDAVDRARDGG